MGLDEEVKTTYGKSYFDQKVAIMKSYMTGGITGISPVINSYTDALLDVFPQERYQPMDLYFKTRVFISHHLPEIVYQLLYIGQPRDNCLRSAPYWPRYELISSMNCYPK